MFEVTDEDEISFRLSVKCLLGYVYARYCTACVCRGSVLWFKAWNGRQPHFSSDIFRLIGCGDVACFDR